VLVKADGSRRNGVMAEELGPCGPRVFRGNHGHLTQHAQRAKRDVFEVADRGSRPRTNVPDIRWGTVGLLYHWGMCAPRFEQQSASHDQACTHRSRSPHFCRRLPSPTCTRFLPTQGDPGTAATCHDDLLEDLSRPGHRGACFETLSGFGRRLHQIDAGTLAAPPNAFEHPIVAANIEARMFRLRGTCGRASAIPNSTPICFGTSLAGQALFAYAPEAGSRPGGSCRSSARCRGSSQSARATTSRSVPGFS